MSAIAAVANSPANNAATSLPIDTASSATADAGTKTASSDATSSSRDRSIPSISPIAPRPRWRVPRPSSSLRISLRRRFRPRETPAASREPRRRNLQPMMLRNFSMHCMAALRAANRIGRSARNGATLQSRMPSLPTSTRMHFWGHWRECHRRNGRPCRQLSTLAL